MNEPLDPREPTPPAVRIGDADRDRVSEVLRAAAGDGRITLDELDSRLDATYAATTAAELEKVTADLGNRTPAALGPAEQWLSATFGGLDRTGRWFVPALLHVRARFSSARLDLRQALFAAPEVVIDVRVSLGGVEIVVDPHTRVVLEGHGVLGGFSEAPTNVTAQLSDASQVVRVTGRAFAAGVTVYRKDLRSERAR